MAQLRKKHYWRIWDCERGSEKEAADTRMTWDATSAGSLVAKPSGPSGLVPLSLMDVYGGFLPAQGM